MPPEEFENIINNKEKENESHQLVLTPLNVCPVFGVHIT